uniref:Dof1 n=1 Tax=Arundo donax TaxID=35708 RepID=A0A0A9FQY4_ARUDO
MRGAVGGIKHASNQVLA